MRTGDLLLFRFKFLGFQNQAGNGGKEGRDCQLCDPLPIGTGASISNRLRAPRGGGIIAGMIPPAAPGASRAPGGYVNMFISHWRACCRYSSAVWISTPSMKSSGRRPIISIVILHAI